MFSLESCKKKLQAIDLPVFVILFFAIALRLFLLEMKPLHHDEGVNGWFMYRMLERGFYAYDPTNYHGPILFYIMFVLHTLFGAGEWVLRFPSALAGILSVYWVFKFSKFLGRRTCLLAAAFLALSPAFTYYSRYAIFETLVTLFSLFILLGIIGLKSDGSKKYLYYIIVGVTGLILNKETSIIHIGCFVIAYFVLISLEGFYPSEDSEKKVEQQWKTKDLYISIAIAILVLITFYSGFFLHPEGISAFISSFTPWLNTGVDSGFHAKPFSYWLKIIFRYEHAALLGLICCPFYVVKFKERWIKYIAIYGCGCFLAYSLIPYKTPWLLISFLWTFYFVLADVICKSLNSVYRVYGIATSIFLLIFSFSLTVRTSFFHCEDKKEIYPYVHSYYDVNKMVEPLKKMVKIDPINYDIQCLIFRENYWPLPYLLEKFYNVGYYDKPDRVPPKYDADYILVQEDRAHSIESYLNNKYFVDTFTMRDAQNKTKRYLSYEKFKSLFPDREPDLIGQEKLLKEGIGLKTYFYKNKDWSGQYDASKVVSNVNYECDHNSRPYLSEYSVKVEGEINIPSHFTTFILVSDDGGYVEIADKKIIEDAGPHGTVEKSGVYYGESGWQKINVGLYDIGGGSVLRLLWIDTFGNKVLVPNTAFRLRKE